MSFFRRLSASLTARIDQVVAQMENHDAIIEAAIREARQATAKAKVRLARVRSDGERLETKLAELREAEIKWSERARRIAKEDENRALECLRRRRGCQRQRVQLEKARENHQQGEVRLVGDVREAEERVADMTQKRHLMRTRQSAAEALNSITRVDSRMDGDVADAFERWEVRITEAEYEAGTADFLDSLEQRFADAEEQDALRAELDELLLKEENHHEC
ncbi:PspA/IM30 family protein [Nitrosococcus wardiae]|nr:PspA/IM30 family protein [Nitrosococcus wardiae]